MKNPNLPNLWKNNFIEKQEEIDHRRIVIKRQFAFHIHFWECLKRAFIQQQRELLDILRDSLLVLVAGTITLHSLNFLRFCHGNGIK